MIAVERECTLAPQVVEILDRAAALTGRDPGLFIELGRDELIRLAAVALVEVTRRDRIRRQETPPPAGGRSILAMAARRDEILAAVAGGTADDEDQLLEERAGLTARIAGAPSRGDADLLAKTRVAAEVVSSMIGGADIDEINRLLLGLFADIERIVGGAPPVRAGGRP